MNNFWRSNAQHSDYSHQYCIIKFEVAKRLDLKCSHRNKEIIIRDMIEVLATATVVLRLQHINGSDLHLKVTQFYVSIIYELKKKNYC